MPLFISVKKHTKFEIKYQNNYKSLHQHSKQTGLAEKQCNSFCINPFSDHYPYKTDFILTKKSKANNADFDLEQLIIN